jgi:hypothetical protein
MRIRIETVYLINFNFSYICECEQKHMQIKYKKKLEFYKNDPIK